MHLLFYLHTWFWVCTAESSRFCVFHPYKVWRFHNFSNYVGYFEQTIVSRWNTFAVP